jgi:hypothetical protein
VPLSRSSGFILVSVGVILIHRVSLWGEERGEDCMHSRMDAHADASGVFFLSRHVCMHCTISRHGRPHPHGKQGCKKLQISCNLSDHCNLYTRLLGLWHWYYRSRWWRGWGASHWRYPLLQVQTFTQLAYCCLACSSPALDSCLLAALHQYYTCAGFSIYMADSMSRPAPAVYRQA